MRQETEAGLTNKKQQQPKQRHRSENKLPSTDHVASVYHIYNM